MRRSRIVVLGYIVRGPLGGLAWHHLQYVLGLHALGHDVFFLEDSEDYAACYDPSTDSVGTDPAYGLRFAGELFAGAGLPERWAYFDRHSGRWLGPSPHRASEVIASADIVLNLSGVNPLRDGLARVPVRVLVDTDPAFTQIRHLTDAESLARAQQHTAFFTFGENFGSTGCSIPADGFPWQPTRQPVVLDRWVTSPGPPDGPYTTVMQWDSYPERSYAGRSFGMKSRSFTPYRDLPSRCGRRLELALGSRSAPRDQLSREGWRIVSSLDVTESPHRYQEYVRASKAEFSIAKHGYVETASGWFSERSTSYLASGRPVVLQDTGFSRFLPTGSGVHAFATPEEALLAMEVVDAHYDANCRAARDMAQEWFAADRVLGSLLDRASP